jgi:hypothetical protein
MGGVCLDVDFSSIRLITHWLIKNTKKQIAIGVNVDRD